MRARLAVAVVGLGAAVMGVVSTANGISGSATVTTYAGTGFGAYKGGGFTGDGILATTADISLPVDVEVDAAGNLYIAEQLGNRVRKVDAVTNLVSTVAGTGAYSAGGSGDGGPATQAQIGGVTALALDASGNLYVSENVENYITRIRKVDAATGVISTLVNMGAGHYVADLELGPDGYLYGSHHYPYDVANTSYVMKIDPVSGASTIVPGTTTMNLPSGLAFSSAGNLYVTEQLGNRVRMIDAATGNITTVAGTGGASSSGDGGPAVAAELNNPGSLAFDSAGNLYVGEYAGRRVRKIDALGLITTVAGTGAAAYSGDGGPAIAAAFNTPASVAFDSLGRLYISDTYNYRIRRVAAVAPPPPSNGQIAFSSGRDGNEEIYKMNGDGSAQTRLTTVAASDRYPDWSPDGTKIAFQSERDGTWDIYVMNADGSGVSRLTTNAAFDQVPAWSPDGAKIAFQTDRDGNEEIYVMNADGTGVTRLTANTANDNHPAWSPDGSRIAFYSNRDGNNEIYVMRPDGTAQTRLTTSAANDHGPAWSPDGTKIAFASDRSGDFEIHVMNADGSGVVTLTTSAGVDAQPDWAPDGTRITFMSLRDGNEEVYGMNADGAAQTRLTTTGAADFAPDWGTASAAPSPPPLPPNVVTNTRDSGAGSLRAAIEYANANPGPDTISFAIPSSDAGFNGQWFTITPTTPGGEPPLTDDGTTIDGSTQTSFAGDTNPAGPEIEIDGSRLTFGAGLNLQSSGNSVKALAVVGFAQPTMDGIHVGRSGNVVSGCYLGIDPTGGVRASNYQGIGIDGSGNRIGGSTDAERNVISGNLQQGIHVYAAGGNTIVGNYIGTDARGAAPVPNRGGVFVETATNTIAGNLLSGNLGDGITLDGSGATGNAIQGNFIGTNAAGTAALPNRRFAPGGGGGFGVILHHASGNTIGGTNPAARNVISGNEQAGIQLGDPAQFGGAADVSDNDVVGNYIGTDATGAGAVGNGTVGISVFGPRNRIGGASSGAGNVVSGNAGAGIGIALGQATGNVVAGNRIGTNAAGTAALGNRVGVSIDGAGGNVVGGSAAAARNVISGNVSQGVSLGGNSSDNRIEGNYVGTDASGSAPIGNEFGIWIEAFSGPAATGNVVVGNTASGNRTYGIFVGRNAPGTTIRGNRVGTNAAGTAAVGNGVGSTDCCPDGIRINNGASNVTIGGSGPADRNVISGNEGSGIGVIGRDDGSAPATNVTIRGNYIGTDASGTTALPNRGHNGPVGVGVRFYTGVSNSTIAGNLISGNAGPGIFLTSAAGQGDTTGNTIQGNYVGTNAAGTAAIPNRAGVFLFADAAARLSGNTIGGTAAGAGNVIAGNLRNGVVLAGLGTTANSVQGNSIGVDASGAALGNGSAGVADGNGNGIAISQASDNLIGGAAAGAGNRIAYNAGNGIVLFAGGGGVRNRISRNSIFANGGLGIDLGRDGVTPNDPGDADVGPNLLMNYPVFEKAKAKKKELRLTGTIDTPNPQTVTIEVFVADPDPSGFGEGKTFLGETTAAADGSFAFDLPPVPDGTLITATATDAAGNTSEFAANVSAK